MSKTSNPLRLSIESFKSSKEAPTPSVAPDKPPALSFKLLKLFFACLILAFSPLVSPTNLMLTISFVAVINYSTPFCILAL